MNTTEQDFLNALDARLWTSANKLLPSLDAAVYKHIVLGLIFLKYCSDSFEARRNELENAFGDPESDYYMNPADHGLMLDSAIADELEIRDYYTEKNVFWVPVASRWSNLQDFCKVAVGTSLPWGGQMKGTALLLDQALGALARDNERLKGVVETNTFSRYQVDDDKLAELIDLFSDTSFSQATYNGQPLSLRGKDILGHVYEYFLGQFALAEGKKGGQYYTPKSIVTLIVQMLQPFQGRVYDPAMGSGGFFVQSEEFIEKLGGRIDQVSVYGQESNPTTWRLAAMNMVIRGIEFDFGQTWGDTFTNNQHPDLRADYVMANPPFNMSDWWNAKLEGDPRWRFGVPPASNANFAWMQHMLYHLNATGTMALLLANGSMSSNTKNEGVIRAALVAQDYVECMVALPGQLFTNAGIPACIWFLTKDKTGRSGSGKVNRQKKVLFIDARAMGYMKNRTLRDFTTEELDRIAATYHAWQSGEGYEDVAGFCKSATLEEIKAQGNVLTPGRYVGAAELEDDAEPFEEKMARLVGQLAEQRAEAAKLDAQIKENLASLGWTL